MTTYTTYTDGRTIAKGSGANAAGFPAATVLVGEYDATKRNTTAADVIEVITVPKGTFVSAVFTETLTADASQTIHVGDGSDDDGWLVSADVGTAANLSGSALTLGEAAPNTITGYTSGKFYSAADTIDITVPTSKALDTLKVRVYAVCTILGVA